MPTTTKESWRPVPEWEGFYEVSNRGRVRTLQNSKRARRFSVRTQSIDRYGYPWLFLQRKPLRKRYTVHRLVAAAFIGPCPQGMEVNHIDGNTQNNRIENLEYVTHQENVLHCTRVLKRRIGIEHGRAKLTEHQVKLVRHLASIGMGPTAIGGMYGMSRSAIRRIVNGETWTHI